MPPRPSVERWARDVEFWILVVSGLILGGAIFVLYVARSGWSAPLGPDSTSYMAAADHLRGGRGYTSFDGQQIISWPPLYVALVAGVGAALHVSSMTAAMIISGAVLVGVVVLSARLVLLIHDRRLRIVALGLAVWSPTMLDVLQVGTDGLFVVIALAVVVMLLRRPSALGWAAVVALCWAAEMTRYVGYAVLLLVALVALIDVGLRHAVTIVVVAGAPPLTWFFASGTWSALDAQHLTPASGPAENLANLLAAVGGWFSPLTGPIAAVLGAVVLAVVAHGRRDMREQPPPRPVLILGAYTVLYLLMLLVATTASPVDTIGQRFAAPALVPVLVLLGLEIERHRLPGWRTLAGSIAALLMIGSLTTAAITSPERYHAHEIAATIGSLRESPPCSHILSNDPGAVYLAGWPAEYSPRFVVYGTTTVPDDLNRVRGELAAGDRYCLVWFRDEGTPWFMNPTELAQSFSLREVAKYADADAYTVTLA